MNRSRSFLPGSANTSTVYSPEKKRKKYYQSPKQTAKNNFTPCKICSHGIAPYEKNVIRGENNFSVYGGVEDPLTIVMHEVCFKELILGIKIIIPALNFECIRLALKKYYEDEILPLPLPDCGVKLWQLMEISDRIFDNPSAFFY